jgi:HTH-type transcriptional regulator / antitoxin HigA
MINQPQPDAMPFAPDWASPPGDTILDLIEEREWTQVQLAGRLGTSTKYVNQLIKGSVALTENRAMGLSNVLGASVEFWLKREAQYKARLALLEANEGHKKMIAWLESFPLKELMDAGVIAKRRITATIKPLLVGELLQFFGVASPKEWEDIYGRMALSFRRSRPEQSDTKAISVWLRQGEQKAERTIGPRYDEAKFKQALIEIRALTTLPQLEFQSRLTRLLHDAGVVLVLVPAIPRTHVSGVARWLNPHRPLIQLSLYGKRNDRFWFTLAHEMAHIFLHGKTKTEVFLDDPSRDRASVKEEWEANTWARDFLIPPKDALLLPQLKTTKAVCRFAQSVGIHPGIVVGRLQFDGFIKPSWMNDLKVSFALNDSAIG